jgi:SMC interacting uncharacterized protein involved in chromosome segregation
MIATEHDRLVEKFGSCAAADRILELRRQQEALKDRATAITQEHSALEGKMEALLKKAKRLSKSISSEEGDNYGRS